MDVTVLGVDASTSYSKITDAVNATANSCSGTCQNSAPMTTIVTTLAPKDDGLGAGIIVLIVLGIILTLFGIGFFLYTRDCCGAEKGSSEETTQMTNQGH